MQRKKSSDLWDRYLISERRTFILLSFNYRQNSPRTPEYVCLCVSLFVYVHMYTSAPWWVTVLGELFYLRLFCSTKQQKRFIHILFPKVHIHLHRTWEMFWTELGKVFWLKYLFGKKKCKFGDINKFYELLLVSLNCSFSKRKQKPFLKPLKHFVLTFWNKKNWFFCLKRLFI